jgi:hypothetical protein
VPLFQEGGVVVSAEAAADTPVCYGFTPNMTLGHAKPSRAEADILRGVNDMLGVEHP